MKAEQFEELPKGIHRIHRLPDSALGEQWDSIIVDQTVKDQLLSQAVVNFTVRKKVSRSILPLHGTTLLVGPPGTGKTTLARGLAHKTAEVLTGAKFTLLEVDPHALSSAMMGKTQKAVSDLFGVTIAEYAMAGPTIVLLDEIEALAVDRSKLSLDANPVDIHRATDAVLVQLDALAELYPNLLFVATSNFPQAVDAAFTSRCDLILDIPLPNKKACADILEDCLEGLASTFKPVGKLLADPNLSSVADALYGLDGRAIRKVVANALTFRREVAVEPSRLSISDLKSAADAAHSVRTTR